MKIQKKDRYELSGEIQAVLKIVVHSEDIEDHSRRSADCPTRNNMSIDPIHAFDSIKKFNRVIHI